MYKPRDRYWRTRKLYEAAYLFARGATIVGIGADAHGVVFAFIDSLERQNFLDELRSGKPLIDARIYAIAIKTLQDKGFDAQLEFHGENR